MSESDAQAAFLDVIESVSIFWYYGIVHADLSAFNILWWESQPYIIDFPQAVDVRIHPEAQHLLHRDLQNVAKYFEKYFEVDVGELLRKFD